MLSVWTTIYVDECFGLSLHPYRWVSDFNVLLSVVTAVCSSMYFKNLRLSYSPAINAIGACTFGVLLIHNNSDTMRQWLWRDTLDNVGHYYTSNSIFHAVMSVVAIFAICALLDYIRQKNCREMDVPLCGQMASEKQSLITKV